MDIIQIMREKLKLYNFPEHSTRQTMLVTFDYDATLGLTKEIKSIVSISFFLIALDFKLASIQISIQYGTPEAERKVNKKK